MKIEEAIIIAGGKGTRLMPLTQDKPKALVIIGSMTMLHRQLLWLHNHGIANVIVAAGHITEQIREHLINLRSHTSSGVADMALSVSEELDPLGTAGAVRKAMDLLRDPLKPFIVLNCDDLNDINLEKMGNALMANPGVDACMALANPRLPYGTIEFNPFNPGLIQRFVEKPLLDDIWVSCGVYIFTSSVMKQLPEVGMLETQVFPNINLCHYKHKGRWLPITNPKDVSDFLQSWG